MIEENAVEVANNTTMKYCNYDEQCQDCDGFFDGDDIGYIFEGKLYCAECYEMFAYLRECSHCGMIKPLGSKYFHVNYKNKDGFLTECKKCVNKKHRDRYKKTKTSTEI